MKLGQLIESNFEFIQSQDDALSQSLTFGLKFARVDHPDYPSSMDQSVRELYQNLNPKVKKNENKAKKKSKKKVQKKPDPSENLHLTVSSITVTLRRLPGSDFCSAFGPNVIGRTWSTRKRKTSRSHPAYRTGC